MTEAPERIWAGKNVTEYYVNGQRLSVTFHDGNWSSVEQNGWEEYIRADLVTSEVQSAYASAMDAEYKIREDAFNGYRLALDNVTNRAQTYEKIADELARLLDKLTDKTWISEASASEVEEVDLWLNELRKVKEHDRHQE